LTRYPGDGTFVGASRQALGNKYSPRCDPWSAGLLALNVPGSIEYVPLEELVARANKTSARRRTSKDGREQITLQLRFDPGTERGAASWTVDINLDPAVNYLVRSVVYLGTGQKTLLREWEVTGFKESAPGIYFPEGANAQAGPPGGPPFSKHTFVISEVVINKGIAKERFHLSFPDGIVLTDSIRGTSYRVDAGGRRISAESPLPSSSPTPAIQTAEAMKSESSAEPKSVSGYILPAALVVLIAATAIAIGRILKNQDGMWAKKG
jgi:hypothetical protein